LDGKSCIKLNFFTSLLPSGKSLVLIVLEEGARATLIEEFASAGGDEELEDLAQRLEIALAQHPRPPISRRSPLTPLILNAPSGKLSLMSLIAHFGTGEDVTVRDLRLELFFPTDDATREAFLAFAKEPSDS
jgi:hypothetical protein